MRFRRPISLAVHAALIAGSVHAAFWLRFDGEIPAEYVGLETATLPLLLLIRLVVFVPFRLFDGLWRYTSLRDLRNIVAGTGGSTAVFYLVLAILSPRPEYPESILLIDSIVLVSLISGVRLTRRLYAELARAPRTRRILVFGAGDAGEMIVRDMRNRPEPDALPIGFLDDDRRKVGRSIHGVRVLGTGADALHVVGALKPDEVLIAVPSATPEVMRHIVRTLEHATVRITTLPNLRDLIRPLDVKQIRELRVEDLLARTPVGLDPEPARRLIAGRRVLVTGAGGSIGAEICRQVAALAPGRLIVLDRYENSLVELVDALTDEFQVDVHAVIADITDQHRVDQVMEEHQPGIVFHAAAHKHVPLMETNPCEAVKNNVRGSRIVAEACVRHEASRFVLISTDKAVNPASIMGATKRVAELVARELADRAAATTFVTVRFGNVIGSNGSVVPRFLEQIRRGGPVTVTDPDMRRYFMLIPEAVQLVLGAATLPEPGGTYVLDMGAPLKLLDMARDLIRLSGFIPDEEIAISFVGRRPGEKLHEDLVGSDETVERSPVEKILRVVTRASPHAAGRLLDTVGELERAAAAGETEAVFMYLNVLVPTYSRSIELARA
ncbi:MAG TPA: nucleoside-diphosphate sugar epimerase/dehydratase [Vicinamibacterales bacterium]